MTKNKSSKAVGRPELPEKERRNKIIQFRCTEQEFRMIQAAAKVNDKKMSDWIRDCVIKTFK